MLLYIVYDNIIANASEIHPEDDVFWALVSLGAFVWFASIFYIVKGWGQAKVIVSKIEAPQTIPASGEEDIPVPEEKSLTEPEETLHAKTDDIEIPITEPANIQPEAVEAPDPGAFYQELGRSNILEFPAEYVDRDTVKGLKGNKMSIINFAKSCYKEIGFQYLDFVLTEEREGRILKTNVFDLITDHYASADEHFVNYVGQLKEEFVDRLEVIGKHPDLTPVGKKALVGKYNNMPQLVVWNKKELFLVMVKSSYQALTREEINFFREFAIENKLFKAKIFKVTQKGEKAYEEKVAEEKPVAEESDKPGKNEKILMRDALSMSEEDFKKKITAPKRKHFTEEEIRFLIENKDKFTNEELAAKLERSVDSVTHKLSRTGMARQSYEWTNDKDIFLKKNISKLTYRELAEKLGTTVPSIRARCKKIGIKK